MDKNYIFEKLNKLYKMWKSGKLGGEYMPEDCNPNLEKSSLENYLYFTLPMALNYQRNSYKLWESAKATYDDNETKFVFDIEKVLKSDVETIKNALFKYKLVLQKNKQTEIWIRLCKTFKEKFNGDIRKLFEICKYDVDKIREFIQVKHKKEFPYLSGTKICNYWLYVLYQYTDVKFINRESLSIAPDTHIIQASLKLQIITEDELQKSNIQNIVETRFEEILNGSEFCPIDLHTPLWLWSRNGFREIK